MGSIAFLGWSALKEGLAIPKGQGVWEEQDTKSNTRTLLLDLKEPKARLKWTMRTGFLEAERLGSNKETFWKGSGARQMGWPWPNYSRF